MRRHTPTRLPTRSIRRGAVGHGATKGRTHDTPHPGTVSDARASAGRALTPSASDAGREGAAPRKAGTHDTPHPGTASDARASDRPLPDTLRTDSRSRHAAEPATQALARLGGKHFTLHMRRTPPLMASRAA